MFKIAMVSVIGLGAGLIGWFQEAPWFQPPAPQQPSSSPPYKPAPLDDPHSWESMSYKNLFRVVAWAANNDTEIRVLVEPIELSRELRQKLVDLNGPEWTTDPKMPYSGYVTVDGVRYDMEPFKEDGFQKLRLKLPISAFMTRADGLFSVHYKIFDKAGRDLDGAGFELEAWE